MLLYYWTAIRADGSLAGGQADSCKAAEGHRRADDQDYYVLLTVEG